jgi:hypothetical protein
LFRSEWNTFKPHLLMHINEDKINSENFGVYYFKNEEDVENVD